MKLDGWGQVQMWSGVRARGKAAAGLPNAGKVPDSKGRFPPAGGEIGTFCLRRDGRETYSGAMPWGLSAGITIYSEGVASVPQKGEEGRGVGSTGDW